MDRDERLESMFLEQINTMRCMHLFCMQMRSNAVAMRVEVVEVGTF